MITLVTLVVSGILSAIFRNVPSTNWIVQLVRGVLQSGWNYFAQETEKGVELIHRSDVQEKLSKVASLVLLLCTLSLALLSTACGSVNANLAVATATMTDGTTITFQYCVVVTDSAILSTGASMTCFADATQANAFAVSTASTTDAAVTVIKKSTKATSNSQPSTTEAKPVATTTPAAK